MKPTVYSETTVISYLTAWRSPQLVMAANQEVTRTWWDEYRHDFELYVSAVVRQEASSGDEDAVRRRLEVLDQVQELDPEDAQELADQLVTGVPLPAKADVDALHIAVAAATLRSAIESVIGAAGFDPPLICTPQELIEETGND
jgi:hypothetical protein